MTIQSDPIVVSHAFEQAAPNKIVVRGTRISLSKRVFDKLFALSALVFFAPLLIVISAIILITDGRPIFFGHRRVGLDGRSFRCLKFRTMVNDADARLAQLLDEDPVARGEWNRSRKLRDDPRINCIGAFLRKTSLDELPQFWNVLRGEMSVVGPRPVVMDEAKYYGENFVDYMSVLPGITGQWQVSGRSNTTYAERVAMDVEYVETQSFWGDVKIVGRTVNVLLSQDGAH